MITETAIKCEYYGNAVICFRQSKVKPTRNKRFMQYQYVVILKRDSKKYIDRISILLCSFSVLIFLMEQLRSGHFNAFLCMASAIVLTGLFLNVFRPKNDTSGTRYRNWLLIAGLAWIGMPYLQWFSALLLLLAFLEYQARYPLEIGFSNHEVVINSLIKRKIGWQDFNNVVLKDGLLTLDFKNNRLFQKEVLDDGEEEADEDEFNEFCRRQLLQAGRNPGPGATSDDSHQGN